MKHYMGFLSRRVRERQAEAQKRRVNRLRIEAAERSMERWSARQRQIEEEAARQHQDEQENRSWGQKLADRMASLPSLRWWL